MSCDEFKRIIDYDPWVAPHQLLPYSAVIFGMDPTIVMLFVYMWETFEVIMFNCLGVAEEEQSPNALISDPFQAVIGILVGIGVRENIGNPFENFTTLQSFMSTIFCILPGICVMFPDTGLEWGYIGTLPIAIATISIFTHKHLNDWWFIFSCVYIITTTASVFALSKVFNSFYTGVASGVVFGVIARLKVFVNGYFKLNVPCFV